MPRYAPLPSRSAQDADSELADTFGGDDDDDDEETPLNPQFVNVVAHVPGAYDFEREYDCPPPGSPPQVIGNSNGTIPTSPPVIPSAPRSSFFRRAVGAILPTHYARLPGSDPAASGVRGGGIENDGVFANVTAKPQRARTMRTEDGSTYFCAGRRKPEGAPAGTPIHLLAQAEESVPPYWETTVHAPGMDGSDMIIDDLPSGSVWVFLVNMFISFFFQFVGFLLTYLLHTSHAAKYGSRAGLGLTLIQYGFYSRAGVASDGETDEVPEWPGLTPNAVASSTESAPNSEAPVPNDDMTLGGVSTRDWLSFIFMTVGWFLLLSSFIGFWRIKRWESSIRASSAPVTPEDIERDLAVRRNLESVFGFSFGDERERRQPVRRDENGAVVAIPTQELLEEARLARDLRAAGLL
ncbi:hypothetical protein B0H16DRAFT_1606875 [Mycena metata]|uniref:Metal homeostatis protein bsd2 n=1 Tax=Mycena metata TaxID=1033252 RepID=A0AAD7HF52_9AGAR|nr:hypothetical protein B0H16DRAFT_1606875 [Mycena metata]